jgi:hypothetical protein
LVSIISGSSLSVPALNEIRSASQAEQGPKVAGSVTGPQFGADSGDCLAPSAPKLISDYSYLRIIPQRSPPPEAAPNNATRSASPSKLHAKT